jgi:predicted transposase YbfD/YdcC
VKDNQEQLKEDIQATFVNVYDNDCQGVADESDETVAEGHGRQERRLYEVSHALSGLRDRESWTGRKVIGKCYSERTEQGKTRYEARYFIGSTRGSAKRYGEVLRNHWRIEKCLHGQREVTFGEDASRIQERWGGQNLALLRRLALGLLKQHPSKGRVRSQRYEAALEVEFLEEILKQ